VLQRRTVGGLSSVVIEATDADTITERATRAGAQVSPATLQDLVAAYGVEAESLEGTHA